jgi:hypothetical protein
MFRCGWGGAGADGLGEPSTRRSTTGSGACRHAVRRAGARAVSNLLVGPHGCWTARATPRGRVAWPRSRRLSRRAALSCTATRRFGSLDRQRSLHRPRSQAIALDSTVGSDNPEIGASLIFCGHRGHPCSRAVKRNGRNGAQPVDCDAVACRLPKITYRPWSLG